MLNPPGTAHGAPSRGRHYVALWITPFSSVLSKFIKSALAPMLNRNYHISDNPLSLWDTVLTAEIPAPVSSSSIPAVFCFTSHLPLCLSFLRSQWSFLLVFPNSP